MKKEYSVLMSVYDKERPEYLQKSIGSMLRQSVPPKDFVIVCDGPLHEELAAVVEGVKKERPRLFQILQLPVCGGLGNALNQGMRLCRCEVVARMDSDDISLPSRCEKQLIAMEAQGADIVSAALIEFDGEEENLTVCRTLPETHEEILRFAGRRNPFNHPCVMYKKSVVLDAGGYRHCPYFEDYDLWTRMLKNGARGYNLPEPLLHMRAGAAMYERRGGISYALLALRFRWKLTKMGLSSFGDFLVAGLGQALVSLLPGGCRKLFYQKVLRKGE